MPKNANFSCKSKRFFVSTYVDLIWPVFLTYRKVDSKIYLWVSGLLWSRFWSSKIGKGLRWLKNRSNKGNVLHLFCTELKASALWNRCNASNCTSTVSFRGFVFFLLSSKVGFLQLQRKHKKKYQIPVNNMRFIRKWNCTNSTYYVYVVQCKSSLTGYPKWIEQKYDSKRKGSFPTILLLLAPSKMPHTKKETKIQISVLLGNPFGQLQKPVLFSLVQGARMRCKWLVLDD